MTRLSLLMGVFLATSVTCITMLIAITQNITSNTLLYRGTIIFFIFGFLGTFFGSVLEVIFMPILEEEERIKVHDAINGEDKELQAEIGDLLEEYRVNKGNNEQQIEIGTPTDESKSETDTVGGNSTVVS